jgi:CO/xanthine dehydrogenase FAD-binding subunit
MTAYHRPTRLDQALALLADRKARVLAGGTDLYPTAGSTLSGTVIDVTAVAEMGRIDQTANGLRIGAAVTWGAIAAADLPPALAALQQAAPQVGGRQIQNAGTIGGNLCNASPAADGVPPLLVLDAEVEIASGTERHRMPLAAFLTGPRKVALRLDQMLTAVIIPPQALKGRSAFEKLGARTHLVISIAMVAVRLVHDGVRVTDAAVAVGSCSGVATRLPRVEAALKGIDLAQMASRVMQADVLASLAPIDDVRATAAYRIEAATELVRRALGRAG